MGTALERQTAIGLTRAEHKYRVDFLAPGMGSHAPGMGSLAPGMGSHAAQTLELPHKVYGLVVVRFPVVAPQFVGNYGSQQANMVGTLTIKLCELPLAHRDSFILFCKSLVPHLAHLAGTGPVSPDGGTMDKEMERTALAIHSVANVITGHDTTTHNMPAIHIHLQLSFGRCGLELPGQ
jgi:hypothetical protein